MKRFFIPFFLLLTCQIGFAGNNPTFLLPSATISGNTTVCQNAVSPLITFTGSGGTAPYSFIYTITGVAGNQSIQTTGTNNSITLPAPTGTAGIFTYNLVSVEDSSVGHAPTAVAGSIVITVKQQANADLNATVPSFLFNGFTTFKECANQATQIDFTNASTTISTNTNYTINWGDGSPNFLVTSWTNVSHTYQIGLWTMTYSISAQNGCNIVKTYKVFVGNNPAVGIGNPGNTDICISSSLTFPITGTENNPPGTTYTVSFNDGSPSLNFNHPPPSSVTHSFLTSSCGTTSTSGSNSYQNSFFASIVASNPCDNSSATVVPIRISTPPVADFSLPQTIKCTNSEICLTNSSTGGDAATSTSCSTPKIIWTITPSTGFTVTGGTLGNDFGSTNTNSWTSGTNTLCLTFTAPGNYSITMKIGNRCGTDQKIKNICIEAPLTPSFAVNTNAGCVPVAVTTTNNTNLTNTCTTPTYLWHVTYAAAYCGTSAGVIPDQTTSNASYNFTEPGIYTIKLTVTNSCGSFNTTQTVTVKKPPTVSIAAISNNCGSAAVTPTATITNCAPSGGTLTYAWSFPGGTPSSSNNANPGTITYPAGGPYSVSLVVTNECGPSNTATQSFSVNTPPSITNSNLSQTICSGSSSTLVNLTANPSGTTFNWTAIATAGISGFTASGNSNTIPIQTITTTNTNPGTVTYTITPSFGGCNGTPVTYVINVNPAPTITAQPVSSSVCVGGTPTTLTVALSSTSVTPTYQWYSNINSTTSGGTLIPGATSATFNPPASSSGTLYYYCIISLSSGGCSGLTSAIATVTVNPVATITTQPMVTQNICIGGSLAALTVAYSGGSGTASYQWYSNTNNSTSGGSAVGTNAATFTPPVFSTPGTYYYYVTVSLSGTGCGTVTSDTAEVVVVADPALTTQPLTTQTVCQNSPSTILTVVASGGIGVYSYQWYTNPNGTIPSGTAIAGATSASYTPPTNVVGTTYYYCIVSQTGLGCTVTSTIATVIVNASPTIQNQPVSSTVCLGGIPATLSLTYTNGVGTPTYQWYSNTSNDNTGGNLLTGATNATFTPPAGVVGTIYYYCSITFPGIAGSCATVKTNTATVTVIAGATITQEPIPSQSLCVGATISNPLTVTFSGGTGTASYQWYSNTSNSTSGGTPVGTNTGSYVPPVFTTPGDYYYYVIITLNGSGCGDVTSQIAQITVQPDPIITTQPLPTQSQCQNSACTPLSVAVSGGIGTFNYQWYSSTINDTSSGTAISGETASTFLPPTATPGTTYYYCVVTQSVESGCNVTSAVAQVTVNISPVVVNQPQPSTICVNGTATVLALSYSNGVGTPNYQWYSNTSNTNTGGVPISGATNPTYTPPTSTAGTLFYYGVVTFSAMPGGCSIITTNTAEVTVNENPVIANLASTICSATSFNLTPSSGGGNIVPTGTTYTWIVSQILPAGSVTGASVETTPQNTISQTLVNSTTNAATVIYTVTPVSGICSGNTFTITVTVNPAINPNVVLTNNGCYGVSTASITTNITGGIPFSVGVPYVVNWTGPNGFVSTANSITNLVPGSYSVTIQDAGGCPFSNTYTIVEPADIVITTDNQNDITCYASTDGSISISVSGGTGAYSYSWTKNTAPYAVSEDLTNLGPGTYVVTISDANNCGPKTATFTITEPTLLLASLSSQIDVLCYGDSTGAITVNVSGGTLGSGYVFSWTGPSGFVANTQNLTGISAGTFQLTVTDANGCVKSLSVVITQSSEINIAYTTTPITCYGANNASLITTLSGGNPPYLFQWNNLSTSLTQTNLSAGDNIITVTDNVGCIKTQTINIPEAPVFMVNPTVTNVSCFGAHNGSINLNLTGGIAPVALTWSDGSTSGLIRNNLGPGTYTATISDGTPCYIVRTFTIVEPQPLVLSSNITNAFDCTNAAIGAIDLIVAGGTLPYLYSWSNGSSSEDLSNVTSGNYLVTVTDAKGCIKTAQYTIVRPNPISINVATQTDFSCSEHTVEQNFVAQVSGGIPPYQLQWSNGIISGANNEIMHSDDNGTVLLTATDSNNCTATYTVIVDTPVLGYPSFETTSYGHVTYGLYAIGDPIQFTSTITGDYVSVSWDFGDGTFSTELNPVHTYLIPRDYIITQTVSYPFGCVYVQTISLIIEKGYVLVVPTAFTPNNDTVNDTYRPVTKALKNITMVIYDTWGSLIYSETGDVLVGWDGNLKGYGAENGNYYSKVSGETFYGTTVNSNQTFVLIK
jgi:gliding motility-associated-like protein